MSANEHCLILVPEPTNVVKELSLSATQIALLNFEWHYETLVLFNSTLWCGVEMFLKSYKKNTIVGKGTFFPKFAENTKQYVLFVLNVADMVQVLKWMQKHEFDNTGKCIIVCQSQDIDECDEKKAVKVLWEHKITNVVYLKSVEGEVVGYTYFPLNDTDCKTDVPVKLTNLDSCFNETHRKICCDIFSIKLKNFNNCPLIASSFIQQPYMNIKNGVPSGANGDLLGILAEGLNASLRVITPRIGDGWGRLEKDGTWSGSLADVYYDYANLSITSAALTLARFSHFHMSIDYNSASVVWVTNPPKKMPSSLNLTHSFQLRALIALSICFLIVVICSLMLRSRLWYFYSRVIEGTRPRISVVFYSWMICMGLPSTRLPTKPAYMYMVLLWMWLCIFIRTFYQVSLITVLQANYYFREFETIDDVLDAGYPLGGGAALKDYFIDYPIVYNKWIHLNTVDIIPMMRSVSKGYEFVLAMNMETAQAIISEEKINVHILPQKVVTSPTVIFFKKFSPLAASVNRILVNLVESGFSYKLHEFYTAKVNETENTLEPINIDHYTGCYVVLILGWLISFIFFVGEILFNKKK
ncbi:Ionotropic receptor [Operophtera brumata]|uniref:Ionotropic receptor n=1 Tax=Operophtera brumata TaxID=104452 RepID=A0A0L7LB27_OPEBR|nr:Ionotropic receptor [Operophtera brumata]